MMMRMKRGKETRDDDEEDLKNTGMRKSPSISD